MRVGRLRLIVSYLIGKDKVSTGRSFNYPVQATEPRLSFIVREDNYLSFQCKHFAEMEEGRGT